MIFCFGEIMFRYCSNALGLVAILISTQLSMAEEPRARDARNIRTGSQIPDEGYCDQPYVVVTNDGNWLCTLTTGPGNEGQGGQHIVSTISADHGKSWSPLVDIEPSDGPAASWAIPLVTPSGRVYVFYDYNGDRVDRLPGGTKKIRSDVIGWYCYKYSDDNGRTWSSERYRLPLRVTACDRANNWKGEVQIFWGIDKPKINNGKVSFAFTKLGRYMLDDGEGWFYQSDNLLTESDVSKIVWKLLPEGEHGIRDSRFGSVQEEHNHVSLDENRLYLVYRTTNGYPCHCYSNDGGTTWSTPEYMTYTPGGQKIKTPRACPKLFRCENGKYLFWFHNHSGKSFKGRNPVWISGGIERDGQIHWSQPEILLYDPIVSTGMSYPDLIEQDGRYWITETQKAFARVHEIDPTLLEGLWRQGQEQAVVRKGLVAESHSQERAQNEVRLPDRLNLAETGGVTLDFWIRLDELTAGQVILDSRDNDGRGIVATTTEAGTIQVTLRDDTTIASWDCDANVLEAGKRHHVVAIVDDGPRIISFIIDGILCDGGQARQYGWGRYSQHLTGITGTATIRVAPSIKGKLKQVRIYARPLRTSEAVANFNADR